jgi:UDP-3-O-[3-hydroxymyristoyl] glucosamine N-acyltransferase
MKNKTYTLAEIAQYTNSCLIGNPECIISGVADLDSATEQELSFLANPRYERAMLQSHAGAVFVSPTTQLIENRNFLINDEPSQAFQKLIEAFYGTDKLLSGFKTIHPTAIIHESSRIGQNITIGPYVVIDQGTSIGDGTTIGAGSYIGPLTTIGTNCLLHPHVTIREQCKIGNRVVIQPGAVIGACGFGFTTDKNGRHTKLSQVGTVTIHDDVEIGANTTIDRARFKTTEISRGTKIDNLVQIAHGVVVGEDNIIVAQSGIAGSTTTGRHVVIAGQVAVAGHIKLGDGVVLSARTGVSKSLPKAGKYGGAPAFPMEQYNRNTVQLRNIETYIEQIKELQQSITKLQEQIAKIQRS